MALKTDIWMPLYIGDYLAATTHLSAMESGAYLHLLMHQWKNGALPSSEEALRRIARVDKDAWSNAWAMLKTFFDDAGGFPVQKRLETIREESQAKKAKFTAKAQNAAKARWEKDASSNAPSNAPAMLGGMHKSCPSPSPSPSHKERTKPTASAVELPEWINPEAWDCYLDVRRKRRALLTAGALNAVLHRLDEFRARGHDPNEILATSFRSNWPDVYEPKATGKIEKKSGEAQLGAQVEPTKYDEQAAFDYWSAMKKKGSVIYEQQAPRWARERLDAA